MTRLSTRFSLAMIGVSLVTLLILLSLQRLIAEPRAESLGQDLGAAIGALSENPIRGEAAVTKAQLATLKAQLDRLERGVQRAFADRDVYYQTQRRAFWLSTALTLLLVTGVGWLAGLWLAQPIRRLAGATERVARGDLSARVPQRGAQEIAELAATFNRMTETLERLEEERKATLNDIAHDLRTPLTVIQGRLDAFQDGVRPVTLENVMASQHAVDLMTRLVTDLRTLALAEGGYLPLSKQPVDLCEVARTVMTDFEDRAKQKDVQLVLHTAATPTRLSADPDRLSQIVSNLLENALKYTPRGGQVTLCIVTEKKTVYLTVQDSGRGLGEDDLKRVLNRFYRVDAADERTSESGASGLGLAIVNALTTLHGGTLEVTNAEGGGAQFRVALPLNVY